MQAVKQSIIDLIEGKYQIVKIINLVKYDTNPELLSCVFFEYYNVEFAHNQRLVILHHDTDFYPSLTSVGNTIYNVLRLCANYMIPLEKIILLTNHYGIEDEIKNTAKQICNADSVTVIYTSQWYDFPNQSEINAIVPLDTLDYDYLYCCLNGQQRQHRLMTLCMLQEHNLTEVGAISYHFKN